MNSIPIPRMQLAGLLCGFLLLFFACQETTVINEAEIRDEIMQLHKLQRNYHFEKMAAEFVSQLSDHHISVNRGEISSPSKEALLSRFSSYFNSVEFEKWDDINPPIIRFSDDYSLAYAIVDKEVVVKFADENGAMQEETTQFAWVAIYKRYGGAWKIDCIASTNKPSETL